MTRFILFLSFLFLSITALAQGSVRGRVLDRQTDEDMPMGFGDGGGQRQGPQQQGNQQNQQPQQNQQNQQQEQSQEQTAEGREG